MFDFLKDVKDIKFHVIILVLGVILIVISLFRIDDIAKLQITRQTDPIYVALIIGVLLVFFSLASYLISEESVDLGWINRNRIKKIDNGYIARLGQGSLCAKHGRIEDYEQEHSSAIVLPANEFFDDECVSDKKSSLGAFIHSKFPHQIKEIQDLLCKNAKAFPADKVEKETGIFRDSYGVSTSIFLNSPLSSKYKIIVSAVTSQRAGKGLKSEISYIFQSVREINKIAVDKRLTKLYLPLLGAGHGCLGEDVALFALILAWTEIMCEPLSRKIEINIIVFKAEEKSKPTLSLRVIKRILYLATGMLKAK